MSKIRVTVHASYSNPFLRDMEKVFEYDEEEFSSSEEAMLYVQSFMAMGYSITTKVFTEDRNECEDFISLVVAKVAGYA